MRAILVLGAGGHGKVVADALRAAGRMPAGFLDADPDVKAPLDLPVLGTDEHLSSLDPNEFELANGVGSTDACERRRTVFENARRLGFGFVTVIHPRAVVSPAAHFAEGVQIMAGAIVQAGAVVGENALINTGALIDHDCDIGPHCHIATGARLSGTVKLGRECHIGAGATMIQGTGLGAGCLVGAGAVVIRSFGDSVRLVGVPARELR